MTGSTAMGHRPQAPSSLARSQARVPGNPVAPSHWNPRPLEGLSGPEACPGHHGALPSLRSAPCRKAETPPGHMGFLA